MQPFLLLNYLYIKIGFIANFYYINILFIIFKLYKIYILLISLFKSKANINIYNKPAFYINNYLLNKNIVNISKYKHFNLLSI